MDVHTDGWTNGWSSLKWEKWGKFHSAKESSKFKVGQVYYPNSAWKGLINHASAQHKNILLLAENNHALKQSADC